ncbi:MAG: GWxTD domain-containing protein [Candidatus Aminicenantes bacterium]|nr:GWxTD domain-containing protein [Candidatus Aminicenantes bacterium]
MSRASRPLRPAGLVLAAGLVGLAAGCGGVDLEALDPESASFFDTARLVMTGAEQSIFRHLPDAQARREFIADFWEKRDPDPETEANEFKEEFDRRVEYCNAHFREGRRGINTDRGRIYLYLGPPDQVQSFPMVSGGTTSVLWWSYYTYVVAVEFIDDRGLGEYKINEIDGSLFDAIDRAKLGAGVQASGAKLNFVDFGLRYDREKREIVVSVPTKKLNFKEEGGLLTAEFEFVFYLYREGAAKEKFTEARTFSGTAADLEKGKEVIFAFPREVAAGKVYIDAIVNGRQDNGRVRKIFEVKI